MEFTFVFGLKRYAAALAAALALGLASPSPGSADGTDTPDARASAAPAPSTDKPGALALTLVQALQQGTVDRGLLSASLNAELGDDALAGYRTALTELGKPLHVRQRARYREDTRTTYVYRITTRARRPT